MGSKNYAEQADFESAMTALKWTAISSVSQVLRTAVELDLLEIMAKEGPVSASFLAAQLPTKNAEAAAVLDRMLSLLCSFSVLDCTLKNLPDGFVERLYGLTPVSKFFTKDSHGRSFGALLLLGESKPYVESWYCCKEAILEGGYPFNKAHGSDLFEYLGKDPSFSKVFNEGMSDYSMVVIDKILEIYDGFQGLETLVDVGGGLGTTITAIVSKYPTLKGINFDLPHVVKNATSSSGVVHVGGDMFKSVPKGDAILMKSVLHNWADDKCVELLKNCYESLPKNGKVIIADHILPESPNNTLEAQQTYLADVLMFGYIRGAKERTEKEVEALAKQAGFKGLYKICDAYATWIMELHK